MTTESPNGKDRLRSLEADASRVMKDLSDLSAKLRETASSGAGAFDEKTVTDLSERLAGLQQRASSIASEGQKTLASIDKSVRANPYLWILGALGLGVLLGKVTRS